MKAQNKLSPEQTVNLMAALMPVKVSKGVSLKKADKADKAKTLPKPPALVKVDMKALPDTKPVLLALPKPKKGAKKGVFAGIAVELGRMITKPANNTPDKPTDEQRTAVLLGLGVNGNPIKQVAKRCTGLTSAATIWGAIDQHRAANNGEMPLPATLDALKLMCVKRGEFVETRVKLANIKCELWAYACYYQIGKGKGKPQPKKAN